ncbi:MAG: MYXO-CTERM sorting domain-containing protein, partial [Myxococcales bacterium]|nr:MYXO-CTERM sorting domain-containing protein [Myxococcales bacterium]
LLDATPEDTVDLLESQGLAECYMGQCAFTHDMLPPLMDKYLPVPDGVTPEDFYGCLLCYAGLIDQQAWDAAAFAADLDQRVIQPGMHAQQLLSTWPYITRMYTTISPNEMYTDPIFHINGDLPDVDNVRMGSRYTYCDGGAVFTLPDGRQVYMPNPNIWPDLGGEMPWEEDVELAAMMGPNQVISDRTDLINELLAAWNAQHGWPGGDDTTTDTGAETGSGTDGTDTIGGTNDDDVSGTDSDAGLNDPSASCACSSEGQGGDAPWAWSLLALAGLGLVRRRR